ncbi:MAG: hypothetical protein AB7F40_04040 [Victivallaceae bacterium]|nr:hypothetical protein [Victivallaceae bacterium]
MLDNLRWAHVLCGNSEHLSITVGTSVANKTVSYLPIMFPFLSDERLKEIEQQCAAIISVRRESYAKYVEYFSISFMLYMPAKAIKDVAEEPNTAQEAAIFSMLASCEKPFDCKLEELMYTIPCLGKPYYKIKNDATLKNFAAKDFDQSTFGNTVASMLYTFTIGITGFFARSTDLLNRTRILCALELYRRANGAWPDKLDSLVPEFLPKLPISELTGKPFEYRHGEIEYSERHFDFRNGRVICGETVTRTVDGVMLPASKCNDDYDIDVAALTPLPEEK